MNSGFRLQDSGRVDVETVKEARRVRVIISQFDSPDISFYLTLSEARGISSALMGAAADC
jgi:hypothetical protein